ncbi:MAG: NAD-dependent epimerase/dehydratase family protein [Rhodospirillaceae bacterium]
MLLVTGGTGYVGSQICKILRETKIDFRILSRNDGPLRVKHDLLSGNENELREITRQYKRIIHCAWFVERNEYLQSTKNFDWIKASLKLASCLDGKVVKHFLALGTCLEYAPSTTVKNVDSPIEATSNYSLSKTLTYRGLSFILSQKKIPFAWCRLFHMYGGEEQPAKLIPSITEALRTSKPIVIKNSDQLIDLSHVSSIASDIVRLSENYQGIFNLCSGKGGTVEQHIRARFPADDLNKLVEFRTSREIPNNLSGIRNAPV